MQLLLTALVSAQVGAAVALVAFALISAGGRFDQGDPMIDRVE